MLLPGGWAQVENLCSFRVQAIGLQAIQFVAAGTSLKMPWPVGDDVHT